LHSPWWKHERFSQICWQQYEWCIGKCIISFIQPIGRKFNTWWVVRRGIVARCLCVCGCIKTKEQSLRLS
jgi:hypothetical protein